VAVRGRGAAPGRCCGASRGAGGNERAAGTEEARHLDGSIALWCDDAGWTARFDHRGGWRQTVKPIATADQALYALFAPAAHEPWGRALVATSESEEARP
jgi:hypothetical protein